MDADSIIENAVGELYRGFFKLGQEGKEVEIYRHMRTLSAMLAEDMQDLRAKKKVQEIDW